MAMSTTGAVATDDEHFDHIKTVAGTGEEGSEGDGGPAAAATLNRPYGIAVDGAGALYFSDSAGNRVRKITTDGKVRTVAGNGTAGFSGDGAPAVSAQV